MERLGESEREELDVKSRMICTVETDITITENQMARLMVRNRRLSVADIMMMLQLFGPTAEAQ